LKCWRTQAKACGYFQNCVRRCGVDHGGACDESNNQQSLSREVARLRLQQAIKKIARLLAGTSGDPRLSALMRVEVRTRCPPACCERDRGLETVGFIPQGLGPPLELRSSLRPSSSPLAPCAGKDNRCRESSSVSHDTSTAIEDWAANAGSGASGY
jgi:hypothetical protein